MSAPAVAKKGMTMLTKVDYYTEAVRAWQNANRNLKLFAKCCAQVNDRQTKALAADCKVKEDTIENYRLAYWLYTEIQGMAHENASEPDRIWEEANISLWVKAARLRTSLKLPLAKAWDYLKTAADEGMTREQLGAHVDEKENDTPHWLRRLRSVIRMLMPARDDWKTELPPEKRERYERAVEQFTAELKAIAEDD